MKYTKESFFATFRRECYYRYNFYSYNDLIEVVSEYIGEYNKIRIHSYLITKHLTVSKMITTIVAILNGTNSCSKSKNETTFKLFENIVSLIFVYNF